MHAINSNIVIIRLLGYPFLSDICFHDSIGKLYYIYIIYLYIYRGIMSNTGHFLWYQITFYL